MQTQCHLVASKPSRPPATTARVNHEALEHLRGVSVYQSIIERRNWDVDTSNASFLPGRQQALASQGEPSSASIPLMPTKSSACPVLVTPSERNRFGQLFAEELGVTVDDFSASAPTLLWVSPPTAMRIRLFWSMYANPSAVLWPYEPWPTAEDIAANVIGEEAKCELFHPQSSKRRKVESVGTPEAPIAARKSRRTVKKTIRFGMVSRQQYGPLALLTLCCLTMFPG